MKYLAVAHLLNMTYQNYSTYLNSGEGRCLPRNWRYLSTWLLQSDLGLNEIPAQMRTRSLSHLICKVVQTVFQLFCFSGNGVKMIPGTAMVKRPCACAYSFGQFVTSSAAKQK